LSREVMLVRPAAMPPLGLGRGAGLRARAGHGHPLKYQNDIAKFQGSEAAKILAEVKRELAAAT
jgi:hypothetical protein